MTQSDTFGFDKARLVGVYHRDSCLQLEPLQLPLFIDDSLMMVLQFDDQVLKKYHNEKPEADYETFLKKYNTLEKQELEEACSVQDKDLFMSLPHLIPCVGCRRSVEHLFHQVQKLEHSVYESLSITRTGALVISSSYIFNPKSLYHLFYCIKPKLHCLLQSLMNSKKNKRCIFHSLKMQKPTDIPTENKPNLPKWCNWSIMDVWDKMCHECQEEVAMLECRSVIETMENYLKKHRFCAECKSKVMRAFRILIGEVDCKNETGFCSAIYEGLRSCNTSAEEKSDNGKSTKHIHICCERPYIAHMLAQADLELVSTRNERHAKTIDIAQEEVCICLALHLYQRLHRVWHQKLVFEQTWLTLFYLGVESIQQNLEMFVEDKGGIGRMEALCEELEQAEKDKELKQQKKRLRKKRQKRRKDQKNVSIEGTDLDATNGQDIAFAFDQQEDTRNKTTDNSCTAGNAGKFRLCLLDMFTNEDDCACSADAASDDESGGELTKEEILEFEKNRSQIDMQRTQLREKIRQEFENFCNTGSTNGPQTQ